MAWENVVFGRGTAFCPPGQYLCNDALSADTKPLVGRGLLCLLSGRAEGLGRPPTLARALTHSFTPGATLPALSQCRGCTAGPAPTQPSADEQREHRCTPADTQTASQSYPESPEAVPAPQHSLATGREGRVCPWAALSYGERHFCCLSPRPFSPFLANFVRRPLPVRQCQALQSAGTERRRRFLPPPKMWHNSCYVMAV